MKTNIKSVDPVIDSLAEKIAGYTGYGSLQHRHQTDSSVRTYLSSKLQLILNRIATIGDQLIKDGGREYHGAFHQIFKSLKTIIDSLHNPCYSNHSFFSTQTISQSLVNQLYHYDSQLIDQIIILEEESTELTAKTDAPEIAEIVNHLYDLIDGINQTLTEREFIIMGESA
ncbi:MAG: hypothetical protein SCK70_09210 [bacterium]|nr:hypothetical protein [bacterium]